MSAILKVRRVWRCAAHPNRRYCNVDYWSVSLIVDKTGLSFRSIPKLFDAPGAVVWRYIFQIHNFQVLRNLCVCKTTGRLSRSSCFNFMHKWCLYVGELALCSAVWS